MSNVNRSRYSQFKIAMYPEERALLEKNAYEFGMSKSEYIRSLILYGAVVGKHCLMDKEQANNLIYEINKIGNNINQIAYRANVKSYVSKSDIVELKNYYNELIKLIGEIPFLTQNTKEEWEKKIFSLIPEKDSKE